MTWFIRSLLGTSALVAPLVAPAVTTTPSSVIRAVEQTVFTYDAGTVHGVSDNTRRDAKEFINPMSIFGPFVGFVAAETTALRNPNVYEAIFESPINGTTRAAHRASANDFLTGQLRVDSQLNGSFNELFGQNVLEHMESGSSGLLNPPGAVWHHPFDNPSVMQLLRSSEHTSPTLQSLLHPDGIGGFGNFYAP